MRIQVFNAHPKHRVGRQETLRLVRCVLMGERQRQATINIVLTDDRKLVKLNGEFLRHRFTTDVLSFPLPEHDDQRLTEGEVYVNLDQARRQAKEYAVTPDAEIARLIVHGVLHLLGYDDRSSRQKARMTARENHYLRKMNYDIA